MEATSPPRPLAILTRKEGTPHAGEVPALLLDPRSRNTIKMFRVVAEFNSLCFFDSGACLAARHLRLRCLQVELSGCTTKGDVATFRNFFLFDSCVRTFRRRDFVANSWPDYCVRSPRNLSD